MCNECCNEFKGWCKSFTRLETFLTILEGVLFLLFLCFLIFLVAHCITCRKQEFPRATNASESVSNSTNDVTTVQNSGGTSTSGQQCSWTPSVWTEAGSVYYEISTPSTHSKSGDLSAYEQFIFALVKSRPPRDVGCVLTMVSEYWTVTAASCIAYAERAGGLGQFVMVGVAGAARARHGVAAARRGARLGVAAVRSASPLAGAPARLPAPLDRALATVGETLTVLDLERSSSSGFALRQSRVTTAATDRCGGAAAGATRRAYCAVAIGAGAARPEDPEECQSGRGGPLVRSRSLLGVHGEACAGPRRLYADLAAARAWLDLLLHNDTSYHSTDMNK